MKNQGTQTEESCMSSTEKETGQDAMNDHVFEKLKGCLLEVLISNILMKNKKTNNIRVNGAFRNYFGVSKGRQRNATGHKTAENRNIEELEKTRIDTADEDVLSQYSETETETDGTIGETVEKTVRNSNKEQNTSTNGNNDRNSNKRPGRKRKKVQKYEDMSLFCK